MKQLYKLKKEFSKLPFDTTFNLYKDTSEIHDKFVFIIKL